VHNIYMAIDDKLVPEDIAPLLLSEKLVWTEAPVLTGTVHYAAACQWEIPEPLKNAESKAGTTGGNSTRSMIEKLAAVNEWENAVLLIRIYPGNPPVRVIEKSKS